MAALVCRSPPLSYILFPCPGLCWHALPFSILVDTIGTTWNHVELLGFSWMCPNPQYLKCMAALVCRSPPFSYILFPCSGVCWHALPFSLQLDTIGTHWNHHEPPETIWKLHYPRTSWNLYDPTILLMCPTPST